MEVSGLGISIMRFRRVGEERGLGVVMSLEVMALGEGMNLEAIMFWESIMEASALGLSHWVMSASLKR